jgi:replicative DNA helicase
MNEYIIPDHDLDAEQSLLASLIINNKFFDDCEFLAPEEFYKTAHQQIYRAMLTMRAKSEAVDLVSLVSHLRNKKILTECGGAAYLSKLVDTSTVFFCREYVRIIKQAYITRETKYRCMSILSSDLKGEALAEKACADILSVKTDQQDDAIKRVRDIVIEHIERIANANTQTQGAYYKTGFPGIDRALRIMDGKLIIIAGRPGMGKTSLAVSMARNLDRLGVVVGFLSIEMPENEIMDRWLSMESGIDSAKFGRYGAMQTEDIDMLTRAGERIFNTSQKLIDGSGSLDIADVERKCRKMVRQGAEVIFIDQLSQIGNRQIKAGEKTALFTENTTRIARLKKELNIPIFLLAQLNREMRTRSNKEPVLSDLKQSGQIEEDADAVLFVHRPEMYAENPQEKSALHGITILKLAKNRAGPVYRDDRILFDHPTTYFYQPQQEAI